MRLRKILFGDLISRYNAGERNFSRVEIDTPFPESTMWQSDRFKGLDLSGIILRDSNIRWLRCFLEGVIFRDADLTRVDFGECSVNEADFSNAVMHKTQFWQSGAERANFSRADLTEASLFESNFHRANMIGVNLTNASISSLAFGNDFTEANFKGASFRYVTFSGANLTRTNFCGANFCVEEESARVKFRKCIFQQTIMPDGSIRSDT